jgi:hypothetical protein
VLRDIFPAVLDKEILGSRKNKTLTFAFSQELLCRNFIPAKYYNSHPGNSALAFSLSIKWYPDPAGSVYKVCRRVFPVYFLGPWPSFAKFCAISTRNWPCPANNTLAEKIAASDPSFVVADTKKLQ